MLDRYEEFEHQALTPSQIEKAIYATINRFQSTPVKYLGAGDNGIAFLADDGNMIKFTIDAKEAMLWNRLQKQSISGITHLKDVVNLSSSKTGDSLIYALKAEYAPKSVTKEQEKLIQQGINNAFKTSEKDLKSMRTAGNLDKEQYYKKRTSNFINQFQQAADIDSAFENIPKMLKYLAEKGGFIYDLQPNNFKRNSNNKIVLVDPSIPDLTGDIVSPEKLVYENKLKFVLEISRILYE